MLFFCFKLFINFQKFVNREYLLEYRDSLDIFVGKLYWDEIFRF